MTSEWHEVPLRELVGYISKGIAPSYAEEASETTIRVLNQKCNRNFRISYGDSRLHDTLKKKVPPERYVKPDDILINSTGAGTAGRIAQIEDVPSATTIDGHMILIRSNGKVTQKFLGYALKAHQWEVLQLDEGSTGQTELNRDRLLDEIMINYPVSFDEQNAIVGTLESIDRKLIVNKEINDNLADLLQTIYQGRFGNDILAVNQGVLSDICSYSTDKVAVSELNVRTYFSTENMLSGKAGSTEATSLPTTSQTTACHKGDTLISNIRPYFKKIVYCEDKCGCSTDVLCFTPSQPCYSAYLFSTLYADKFFAFMVAGSKGTKMPRGDKQQIMTYPVVLPSEEELAGFNTIASPLLEQIYSNRAENKRLSILRDTLLPKLMSGEINVSAIQL
ncbi:restriction endonuclease subunit S [Phascolarctobacterium faecium]|uniref:restriction endonuclease subunit S n=1 Tax=Phascolarctobacterium faecium TaxID=33025 RepID=UPI001D0648F5|nr:restriction endonuclease subunit S [Phascolarctobacterium faecium]MCB6573981.1 restriction endonuclease subunit S [Phascolarctobacterium faecium]